MIELTPIPESHSGVVYLVEAELDGELVMGVLRLPPQGVQPRGPADVGRQGRIMEALARTPVPVPRILAASEDAVLDNRPFILMQRVDGDGIEAAMTHNSARELVTASFATVQQLHTVPIARTGIADERPTSPAGEVRRWQALRTRAPDELLSGASQLETRLLAALPAERPPTLVHGDYHLGNLLFRSDAVVAVLDWEIAALGQPHFDEAALCLLAIRAEFGEPQPGAVAAMALDEMVALADTGSDFDWYLAATCHKYASILGYNLNLHRRGRRPDSIYDELLTTIPGLIEAGLKLIS